MSRDLISVVVPVYKVESYVEKCLLSIMKQSYVNLEILVINDGSPDNSVNICKALARNDLRIRIIEKENGGLASARNAALDIAKGTYIICVDSDDWLEPNMIEVMYSVMKELDVDMVACDYYKTIGECDLGTGNIENSSVDILSRDDAMKYALLPKYYYGFAWNKMYKNEIVGKLRYNENFLKGEDSPFTCEYISRCQKVAYIRRKLYHYRCDSESISRSSFGLWKLTVLDSYNSIINMLNSKGYSSEIIKIQEEQYANQLLSLVNNILNTSKKYDDEYNNIVKNMQEKRWLYLSSKYIDLKHKISYMIVSLFPNLVRRIMFLRNK